MKDFVERQKVRLVKNTKPSPYEEITQAPVASTKFLWIKTKPARNWSFHFSQVNCTSLVPLLRRSDNSVPFMGTEVFGSRGGLIEELLFVLGFEILLRNLICMWVK